MTNAQMDVFFPSVYRLALLQADSQCTPPVCVSYSFHTDHSPCLLHVLFHTDHSPCLCHIRFTLTTPSVCGKSVSHWPLPLCLSHPSWTRLTDLLDSAQNPPNLLNGPILCLSLHHVYNRHKKFKCTPSTKPRLKKQGIPWEEQSERWWTFLTFPG